MSVHLFIFAIMAGASGHPNNDYYKWRGQWQYATAFSSPEYCHKAASNLGLKKEEYRCIHANGEMK